MFMTQHRHAAYQYCSCSSPTSPSLVGSALEDLWELCAAAPSLSHSPPTPALQGPSCLASTLSTSLELGHRLCLLLYICAVYLV